MEASRASDERCTRGDTCIIHAAEMCAAREAAAVIGPMDSLEFCHREGATSPAPASGDRWEVRV